MNPNPNGPTPLRNTASTQGQHLRHRSPVRRDQSTLAGLDRAVSGRLGRSRARHAAIPPDLLLERRRPRRRRADGRVLAERHDETLAGPGIRLHGHQDADGIGQGDRDLCRRSHSADRRRSAARQRRMGASSQGPGHGGHCGPLLGVRVRLLRLESDRDQRRASIQLGWDARALRGVPDTYSGRLGAAYILPFFRVSPFRQAAGSTASPPRT